MFFTEAFIPLMVIAFLGSLSTGGGGGGESPAQPLEVAILPDTAPPERRTDIFAIYSIVARTGTFLGALAAGIPVLLQDSLGLSTVPSFKVMFLGFALCQLGGAVLYALISPGVEASSTQQQWQNPFKLPSRRRIFTLTGLFSVDTFTTSMVMQSLMAYWFYTKFGLELNPWPSCLPSPTFSPHRPCGLRQSCPTGSGCSTPWCSPTSVQLLPAGRGLRTLSASGHRVLAVPRLSQSDGRSHQGFLHHGGGQPGRTSGHGQHSHGQPQRGGGNRPHGHHGHLERNFCRSAPRRLSPPEDWLRPVPLFHVPQRQGRPKRKNAVEIAARLPKPQHRSKSARRHGNRILIFESILIYQHFHPEPPTPHPEPQPSS